MGLKKFVKSVPILYAAVTQLKRTKHAATSFASPYVRMFPAGHFYSPLPDLKDVVANKGALFDRSTNVCPGVDLNDARQLAVLDELASFYAEAPFPQTPTEGIRYSYTNSQYGPGDAIVLYGMLRRLKPRRVIEVGSGFSSAVMLDTNDRFLGKKTEFVFIEPYADRLHSLLRDTDRKQFRILETKVQDVPLEEYSRLTAGDILFIDSSHVVKIGSDVRHLLWEVLPRLQPGVVVHFHDIFWPFEYIEDWVVRGNAWNEAYFVKSFLQFNAAFQIEYFNTYVAAVHRQAVEAKMPMCASNSGSGLWIKKIA